MRLRNGNQKMSLEDQKVLESARKGVEVQD